MEKYVMVFSETDGETYACLKTEPILYDGEDIHGDFERAAHADETSYGVIEFAGREFYKDAFFEVNSEGEKVYYGPMFYTLEGWFDAFVSG